MSYKRVHKIEVPSRRIGWVRWSELKMPKCQRMPIKDHSRDIAENFNEEAFGLPVVGDRKYGEGGLCLLNGLQRINGALKKVADEEGCGTAQVDLSFEAEIVDVTSEAHESEIFAYVNTMKVPGLEHRLWARYDYGDEMVVTLHGVLGEYDYTFPPRASSEEKWKKNDPRQLKGLNWAVKLAKRGKYDLLRESLAFVRKAYPNDPDAGGQRHLEGLAFLIENLDPSGPTLMEIADGMDGQFSTVTLESMKLQRGDGLKAAKATALATINVYNEKVRPRLGRQGRGTVAKLKPDS